MTVEDAGVAVEIPGAEGEDVSRWQSAAVEAIDRTLFLSDNSE
ncbi:hypothetical protein [Halovivax sp.]|nr:hypothetical protein [Halovivax sp.]